MNIWNKINNSKETSAVIYIRNETTVEEFKYLETLLRAVCKVVHSMPNDFAPDVDANYCFYVVANKRKLEPFRKKSAVLKIEAQ